MAVDEDALRKAAEELQARVDELRARYAKDQDGRTGRALLKARERASEALTALWDEFPDEKPPTQSVT